MFSTTVSATNWVFYAETDTNDKKSYYDTDTLQRNGNIIKVWVQRDYSGNDLTKPRVRKSFYKLDCAEQAMTLLSFVVYNNDNTTTSLTLKAHEQQTDPIVPGSVDEMLFIKLCPK